MVLNCDAANKMVKSLNADLEKLIKEEENNHKYSYTPGETDYEIPSYNLKEVSAKMDTINQKIIKLKHAINVFNTSTVVDGFGFTVDEALVRLAILNKRRNTLSEMRSMPEISRNISYRQSEPEIVKPNFSLAEAEEMYQKVNMEVIALQQALNRTNLLKTFEIDI